MLINTHDVASLARISLTEDEHAKYGKDMESILAFVETIQALTVTEDDANHSVGMAPIGGVRIDQNIIRAEEFSSAELVAQAPESGSGFIKVKKILNQ